MLIFRRTHQFPFHPIQQFLKNPGSHIVLGSIQGLPYPEEILFHFICIITEYLIYWLCSIIKIKTGKVLIEKDNIQVTAYIISF